MSGRDDSPLATVSDREAERVSEAGETGRGGSISIPSALSMMNDRWRVKADGPGTTWPVLFGDKGDNGDTGSAALTASSVLGQRGIGEIGGEGRYGSDRLAEALPVHLMISIIPNSQCDFGLTLILSVLA